MRPFFVKEYEAARILRVLIRPFLSYSYIYTLGKYLATSSNSIIFCIYYTILPTYSTRNFAKCVHTYAESEATSYSNSNGIVMLRDGNRQVTNR